MNNISDKGFSYESPEKQKKSAVRLLILELFILAFAAIVIVGLLQHFKVINLAHFITQIQKDDTIKIPDRAEPVEPKGRKPIADNQINNEFVSVNPKVFLVSDIQNVTIKEKESLLKYIEEYKVFGKKYLINPGEFSDFIDTIEIHLTDTIQPNNQYFLGTNIPVISSSAIFSDNTLRLNIFLSDEAYNNEKTSPEKFFMQSLLSVLFQMQNDPSGIGLNDKQQKDLQDQINNLITSNNDYVVILHNNDN